MESFLGLKEKEIKRTSLMLEDVLFNHQGKIELFSFLIKGTKKKNEKFFSERLEPVKKELSTATPKKEFLSVKKDLINSGVFSESGVYFGRIYDVEIETTISRIENIIISRHFWEKFFLSPLIISHSQILEYQKNKVIVKDAFIKEFELGCQKAAM